MSMDLEEQYDKIYRYCYFKIHHRERAEDITQETFLRFFKNHSGMGSEEAMRFLYTVAHNLCIDEYRKRQNKPFDEETELLESSDPLEGILTRVSVQTALNKLDDSDRELLLLRYINGVPVSVIAKLRGISRFSVHRKIANAMKKFRKYLGEEGIRESYDG
ncbi:MAG: RNA polymerase sigma factor [Lachnospiraceae bacterium]|nr:RNA polymerase sigma factor [Lachnospiraceae bacterium]